MKVGSIGFAGSGKTTLLGALTLSLLQGEATSDQASSDLVLFNFEGVQTFRDLTAYADAIQRGRWPARTESSKVTEYSIQLRRKSSQTVFSLRLPELPGELLDEVWRTDHIPAVLSFLTNYDGYLLLVDATADDPDLHVARYVHLLQGIKRAKGYARSEWARQPLAIGLTKWDALGAEDRALGAEAYAFECLPLLIDFVRSNFTQRAVFPISAVGAVDAAGTPLLQDGRIEPSGIFAPLEWIADAVHGRA